VIKGGDAQADEIRHLKRDLARVTEERDFSKNAAACFARESPPSWFAGKPLPGNGSMQGRTYIDLPLQALRMAVWRPKPKAKVMCIPTKAHSSPAMSGKNFLNSTICSPA